MVQFTASSEKQRLMASVIVGVLGLRLYACRCAREYGCGNGQIKTIFTGNTHINFRLSDDLYESQKPTRHIKKKHITHAFHHYTYTRSILVPFLLFFGKTSTSNSNDRKVLVEFLANRAKKTKILINVLRNPCGKLGFLIVLCP